eukprot:922167-Rhodomonas_salina.3
MLVTDLGHAAARRNSDEDLSEIHVSQPRGEIKCKTLLALYSVHQDVQDTFSLGVSCCVFEYGCARVVIVKAFCGPSTDLAYDATCAVLAYCVLLEAGYTMCGTDLVYAATPSIHDVRY